MTNPEKPDEATPEYPLRGVLHFYSETGSEGGYWAFQDSRHISKVPPVFGVFGGEAVYDQVNPEREGITQKGDSEVLRDGIWCPLPDPITADPDYYTSSLFRGEAEGDHEADQRLMENYGFSITYWSQVMRDQMDERYGAGNWHIEKQEYGSYAIAPDGQRFSMFGGPKSERPYGTRPGDLTRFNVEWHDGQIEQRLSDSVLVTDWGEGPIILENGDRLTIFDKIDPFKVIWGGLIKLKPHPLFTETAGGMWIHADMKGWNREEWAELFFNQNPAEYTPKKHLDPSTIV